MQNTIKDTCLNYLKEHNIDYQPDSFYLCDDGLTFMFKDTNDILKVGILDINTFKVLKIR